MISGWKNINDSTTGYNGDITTIPSSVNIIRRIISLTGMILDDEAVSAIKTIPYYIDSTHYFTDLRVNSAKTSIKASYRNVFDSTHDVEVYLIMYYY